MSSGGAGSAAGHRDDVEIGGAVRRIAIVTTGRESCAAYLARRLRGCGAELAIFIQKEPTVPEGSRRYFKRLWRKRGPLVAADNWLLYVTKRVVRALRSTGTEGESSGEQPEFEVQRQDPELFDEDWIRIIEVERINRDPGQTQLRQFEPDLVLLAGAPILTPKSIGIARVACLNPHCGITPRYAGSSPIDRALFEGQFQEIGYTVHVVAPRVDSGAVIHQERPEWDPARRNAHLSAVLVQGMYERLAEVSLELVAGKRIPVTPQRDVRVTPPAGLFVRIIAELRRARYARRTRRERA